MPTFPILSKLSVKYPWNQISIGWGRVLLLPAMMLLTPFLIFLAHFSYDWSDSGTLSSLAIVVGISLLCSFMMFAGGRILHSLIVAGLLTLFIDIQFEWIEGGSGLPQKYSWLGVALTTFMISWILKENFFRIVTVIFTVFFVVTLGQLVWDKPSSKILFSEPAPGVKAQSLPRIIHLILDAHIGIEGIPIETELGKQMKADLKSFYQKNGFTTFGGAYSRFYDTRHSIPKLLNFSSSPPSRKQNSLLAGPEPHALLRNSYFRLLFDRGYKISVLPNAMYIDYCSENMDTIENCVEVPLSGMKLLKDSDLVVMDKLRLIFSHYRSMGYTYEGVTNAFNKFLGVGPAPIEKGTKFRLPWELNVKKSNSAVFTLTSLVVLDDLSEIILSMPSAHILFSHLIFPHSPYITQNDCSLNPVLSQWKWPSSDRYPDQAQRNTFSSREERYHTYFLQMQCLYKKLDKIFEQMREVDMYDESIIILQGDHGSRITRLKPIPESSARLSKQDLKDSFSTLFAVKFPGGQGHYDTTVMAIEDLLAENLFPDVQMGEEPTGKALKPSAFLVDKNKAVEKVPYINKIN